MSEKEKIENKLVSAFKGWEQMQRYGGHDPFWEDGYNMNLARNHIIHCKNKLEELSYFPEIYYRDTPPEVNSNYMARADEIRKNAKNSLAVYLADKDYQYLVKNAGKIDKKTADKISLGNVLGYVDGLKIFMEEDSLLGMRRHEHAELYIDSFRSCRKKLEKILQEPEPEKTG